MTLREKLRIMVVDDMSTSRGLIVQALEAFGIQSVSHAPGGAEALEALRMAPVHLIISDYNMPGMDGLQFLSTLRAQKATKDTGFILITGRADRQMIEEGQRLGMNNFLKKPFQPVELRQCIEAVVGRL